MESLARLPLFFGLAGKRVVVAGGTAPAAWKAELLTAAGAVVEVFAVEASEELRALAAERSADQLVIHQRKWQPGDLAGAAVAVGAFESDADAGELAAAARSAGVPVNIVDKPAFSDFSFGSIVNRSPARHRRVHRRRRAGIRAGLRAKIEALIRAASRAGPRRRGAGDAPCSRSGLSFAGRRRFWHIFTAHAVTHPDREPLQSDFDAFLAGTRPEFLPSLAR